MSIFIRIVHNETVNRESLIKYFGDERYLACFEHPPGNPHYHIWLHTSKKINAVRESLKRCFDVKGNGEVSVKQKSPTSGINYLCKGDSDDLPPQLFGTMLNELTVEQITQAQREARDWLRQRANHVKPRNTNDEGKRLTLIEQVEEAFDQYLNNRREDKNFIPEKHVTVDDIERFLMRQFFDMKKHWDTGVIGKYRNYLYYKINPEMCFEFMKINRRW